MSSRPNSPDYTGALCHLEIHLDRIRRNYLFLQKRLKKGTDCAAVVKADAYGLGAAMVAPELYKENCRHFYVAHAMEGPVVRNALSPVENLGSAQIYVLHGPSDLAEAEFSRHKLVPVLNTPGEVEYWSAYARKTGVKQPAVLHMDTGMNRLGLSAAEVEKLKNNLDLLKPIDVRYLMSHLACADEPAHPKNKEQLEKFKRLSALLGLPCRLSFANSAGLFLGEEYHFDQVRPGAAIYGINSVNKAENLMQGAVTFLGRILQIRDVSSGETVGYGASYRVPNHAKLATISAGYADGCLRSFAEGGVVYIRGQKCPVVGRVSMDTIVADITHVMPAPGVGEWAEIIGEHQTVDEVAAEAKTIGYEILTSFGRGNTRIYSGQE